MKTFQLEGSLRDIVGKKPTKAIRVNESIPCVLYGGKENIHFEVKNSNVRKLIYTPEIFLVELTIGGNTYKAIMKDLQFHPVTDKVLHIDFLEVNEKKPITMLVPIKLQGLAQGVKSGGKLIQEMRLLKVKAPYDKIPENVSVDVTEVGLGKSIQVGKLSYPGLEVLSPVKNIVATVKLTRASKGEAANANNAAEK
ncbi:MAG: 50S ribosomal protein L25/general stress protein Ctc [Paludibacteraceae bacterium]|nr:50S ribosomal protein L25/general stress protein Ctc [Paludibacteraceae bacterium]MBN2786688.1 50S ribosomal protein L25/general stress protein Ctc [Paludibacteraceae bacterium]